MNAPVKPGADEGEANEPATTDYDSWYSALTSFVFHFCLYLAISLLSGMTVRDKLQPATDVITVADTSNRGTDTEEGMQGDESLESVTPEPAAEYSTSEPTERVADVKQTESFKVDVANNDDLKAQITEAVGKGQRAAAAARAKLAQGLNSGPSTGGSPGKKGRAGRAARWILRFNTNSARDHLAQLAGLGADVAFPERGDKYRFFTNLGGPPASSVRDLTGENRIFWMDEDGASFRGLARELGVASADYMIAFLPESLEAKMLELEMTLAREQGVNSEDGIEQTIFECVRRDGSYNVIVRDLKLAR